MWACYEEEKNVIRKLNISVLIMSLFSYHVVCPYMQCLVKYKNRPMLLHTVEVSPRYPTVHFMSVLRIDQNILYLLL